MEHYQLSEESCNRKVSNTHLEKISESFCRKWRSLPSFLEMETIVVNDIDHSSNDEGGKRLAFFLKWKHMKGSTATYRKLLSALLEINCKEDAEGVCEMLQLSPPEVVLDYIFDDVDACSKGSVY